MPAMNYRHSYHAGNFADVLKHIVLARVITYMKRKPQPFRVIDTHAGAGRYDLSAAEADKTGEWKDGIGRIFEAPRGPEIAELMEPYFAAVKSCNETAALRYYPGSPLIARYLIRDIDALIANELHPEDARLLKAELAGSRQAKVTLLDGWTAVKSLLPPPERRGVVLIDPPFEKADEFSRLATALGEGLKRFANGVYIAWYPIKDRAAADAFVSSVQKLECRSMLDVRLAVAEAFAGLGLTETGVMLFNPPYSLGDELRLILPWLSAHLAEDECARFEIRALGEGV